MPLAVILSLCMGGIACLTPLTLYLIWLGYVNKRERPTVVSGRWDFVSMLLGLLGFLVAGWLVIVLCGMTALHQMQAGNLRELSSSFGQERLQWLLLLGGVGLLGLIAIGVGLTRRRNTLVAYNLSAAAAEDAVNAVLSDMSVKADRFGNLWSDGRPLVEIVPFHLFRHVTFCLLHPDRRAVEELDRRLRATLNLSPAADNPAGRWIVSASFCALITDLCFVLLILASTVFAK